MPVVDDFEDGDASVYSEWNSPSYSEFTGSSYAYEGDGYLNFQDFGSLYTSSGLDIPGPGSTIKARVNPYSDENPELLFGGSDPYNCYAARLNNEKGRVDIYRYDGSQYPTNIGGTGGDPGTGPYNEWAEFIVEWGSDGSMTFTVNYENGSHFKTCTASDTTYGQGIIGYNGDGGADFDIVTYTSPPSAPSNVSASANEDDVSVTWNDNSTNENGFHIDRHVDGSWSRIADVGAGSTSYSDTGLLDGEQYRYRVHAYNGSGVSDWAYSNYTTTALPAPSNGSLSISTPTSGTASWTDTSDNETQFRVQVEEDGSWSTDSTPGSNTESTSVAFAKSADQLRIRVRAETEHTNSDWTYSSTVSTNVSGLTVDATRGTEVDLSWSAVDQEDGYYVYRAQSSGSTEANYSQVADLTAGTTTFTDTGLENGERYYYRVAAYYGTEADALSGEVDATTSLPAAGSVAFDTSVEDEITVSWTQADNSSDGEWELYRSTDGSLGSLIADGLALSTTSYTDTGRADGEEYHYTIRRVTDHASADVQESAIALLPAPTNLSVDAVNGDQATVSWTPNHDNGDQRVEVKPTDGSTWTVDGDAIGRTTTEYTTTNLFDGERYDLRVVAYTDHTTTEDN